MTPASSLVDVLDVAVVVQDHDLHITYANRRATEMLGISADTMRARTTHDARWDVITPMGEAVVDDGHPGVRALRTGEPVRGVVLGVRVDGRADRVWIVASAIPERDVDGAVRQVVITFSDVSEMQRAVREQQAVYQTVFRSMSEGLVIHAPDGSILSANEAAERVLGLSVDQMAGRAATDPRWRLIKPDGTPVDPEYIPSELARKSGEVVPARIIGVHRPTGELAWLTVRADPLREPGDPALRGVVATFTDVTAERETRLALQKSQAQSQRVLAAIPGIVCQYLHGPGGDGRLLFVGGRTRDLLGLDVESVHAAPERALALVLPEARESLNAQIRDTADAGGLFEYDVPIAHPTRGVRWMRIRGVPDPTDEGLLYTGVILDVTEARQLAERVRLTQRREAMGQLAAGVAHNFNNMLAVILPSLELLREHATAAQRPLIDDAEHAGLNAADLVRRMLALGRPESGASADVADLAAVVREALHICERTFDRGIAIEGDVRLDAAPVRARASDLQQVVLNLCLNARDAMDGRDHRRLQVSLRPAGADRVQLEVRDSGVGMALETLQRLGEPFFSTKEPGRGTGLGLASAFNTILEAGGTWHVESTPGDGTSFMVTFPLAPAGTNATGDAAARPAVVGTGTVLLIDDEPMVREALGRMLTHLGYRVVAAAGATEALAVTGVEPQAVLLDLSMPGVSGAALLPMLRARFPRSPVIVLSGHVDDRCALTGAAAVMQKPVAARDLKAMLAGVAASADRPAADPTH